MLFQNSLQALEHPEKHGAPWKDLKREACVRRW